MYQVIDGKKISQEIKDELKEKAAAMAKEGKKVALLDLGAKKNIAQSLIERGCEVTVYPCDTKAEDISTMALLPVQS